MTRKTKFFFEIKAVFLYAHPAHFRHFRFTKPLNSHGNWPGPVFIKYFR
jgi:hypothetical protein